MVYIVKIAFSEIDDYRDLYQHYIVTKEQLDILKNLNYEDNPACCGQGRCYRCKNGINNRY